MCVNEPHLISHELCVWFCVMYTRYLTKLHQLQINEAVVTDSKFCLTCGQKP